MGKRTEGGEAGKRKSEKWVNEQKVVRPVKVGEINGKFNRML